MKALVLGVLLTLATPSLAEPQMPPAGTPAAEAGADAGKEGAQADAEESGLSYQNLSTLGALVLGVLGLLWVRRHTAEL